VFFEKRLRYLRVELKAQLNPPINSDLKFRSNAAQASPEQHRAAQGSPQQHRAAQSRPIRFLLVSIEVSVVSIAFNLFSFGFHWFPLYFIGFLLVSIVFHWFSFDFHRFPLYFIRFH